ncbi:MAG: MmgE/PrpD family protein [Micromonosporaceae bacterium]|nr:MmgE/PrpD family protein [Micromonosporaceae bacterium]
MAYFDELAEVVTATRAEDLPPEAVAAAQESYLDTVAVMVAGRRAPAGAVVAGAAAELGGRGRSSVVGGDGTSAATAALVNATCAHAEDFDDATLLGFGGHTSAILVPTTLAVAEEVGAPGVEALAAYVVGYECILAIAEAMNPSHYEKGFHPTSTIGVFGAAAAAARLYGLTRAQTATAFAIAASSASGIKANFGTGTKPLHCGRAGEGGITAAVLAGRGLTANPGAFEARQGFRTVFDGRAADPAGDGDRGHRKPGTWQVVTPGIGLRKAWPCCGSIHTTIEAVLQLREEAGFTAAEVASVECALHARRLPHTNRPDPDTGDQARFSVQACAAFALLDGRVDVGSFGDQQLARPDLRELMARVSVVADPEATAGSPEMDGRDFGARVTVRLRDGRTLRRGIAQPVGSPDRQLPRSWLDSKVQDCVRGPAGELRAVVDRLPRLADLGELGGQLRSAGTEAR